MELPESQEHVRSGTVIEGGSPARHLMHEVAQEALRSSPHATAATTPPARCATCSPR
ncbi:hypothetical protein [Occultella glacieicola]|uniref:hypothetical protein n=1 Tax=Occultella glacieicola TaxID=2518684 RepID=UPI002E26FD19